MIAFARAHPILAILAVCYALCFLGLAYCVSGAEPEPEDPYYP